MKCLFSMLILFSGAALAQAPAPDSSPPATPNASTPASTAPQSEASATATASAAPAAPSQSGKIVMVDKSMTDAQVKQLLSRGYKPQQRGDEVFYCRKEQQLGSRFEQKICKSAAQVWKDELDNQELVQHLQKQAMSPAAK